MRDLVYRKLQKRPTDRQQRPVLVQKRPIDRQKRPAVVQKRPTDRQKRPIVVQKRPPTLSFLSLLPHTVNPKL